MPLPPESDAGGAAPVLVEVTRGDQVESRHRGSVVVVDAAGADALALGDVDQPVLPRSAVKALQALPLVATGAADALRLGERALALACASHNAEPEHVAGVEAMLAAAGLGADDLACGAHWPYRQDQTIALARTGASPSPLHNNCSGKHAGFLAVARRLGTATEGYTEPDHPVQQQARSAIEAACGVTLAPPAVDGCSAPTWPIPLRALARGFARFGTGEGLLPEHGAAAERLRAAVATEPFLVAGTGRFDTEVMDVTGGRAFVKTGAEGVYTAALPDLGLGVALKIDDGATRASEVVMATVLARYLPDIDLASFVEPPVRSWRGVPVGRLRPAAALRP
ncbi:MAG TPA: asparaginase [Acidimicrobiales bacterium]